MKIRINYIITYVYTDLKKSLTFKCISTPLLSEKASESKRSHVLCMTDALWRARKLDNQKKHYFGVCGCNCVRSVDPFIKTVLVLFVARLATIGDPDVISAQTPFSLSHPKDKRLRRSRESLRIFSPPSRFPPSRCPSELKTYRPSPRPLKPFSRLPLL